MSTGGVPIWNLFFILIEEAMVVIGIGKSDKKSIKIFIFYLSRMKFHDIIYRHCGDTS